jgi:hypothetical protein
VPGRRFREALFEEVAQADELWLCC